MCYPSRLVTVKRRHTQKVVVMRQRGCAVHKSSRRSVALEGFMPIESRTWISSRRSVALEGFMPIERHYQKGSRSCEEQVGKGINHLA
jgi:hypothetical protein